FAEFAVFLLLLVVTASAIQVEQRLIVIAHANEQRTQQKLSVGAVIRLCVAFERDLQFGQLLPVRRRHAVQILYRRTVSCTSRLLTPLALDPTPLTPAK